MQDERPFRQYTEVLAETMRRVGEELQQPVTDVEAHVLSRSVGRWLPFSDAAESLRRLLTTFPVIVASNGDEVSLRQSTDLLGLEFTVTVTAEAVGAYKPSPRHFEAVAKIIDQRNIARSRHLHIANQIDQDLRPAKSTGFLTCFIDRHLDPAGQLVTADQSDFSPDLRFGSLTELTDALLGPAESDRR
ncbi:MAG: hypothetical protein R2706_00770 [Acidimicrobiales bacterium]